MESIHRELDSIPLPVATARLVSEFAPLQVGLDLDYKISVHSLLTRGVIARYLPLRSATTRGWCHLTCGFRRSVQALHDTYRNLPSEPIECYVSKLFHGTNNVEPRPAAGQPVLVASNMDPETKSRFNEIVRLPNCRSRGFVSVCNASPSQPLRIKCRPRGLGPFAYELMEIVLPPNAFAMIDIQSEWSVCPTSTGPLQIYIIWSFFWKCKETVPASSCGTTVV